MGCPGCRLRGPGCGKWWNPVDLHRASESIWWNPSNCKGIRWRRLPISSRHAVFIYIYISILIRIDGGIYPYPYSIYIYIYIHVHVYTCILHINTLCQCNFELMEGELSWEQGPWYGSFFHPRMDTGDGTISGENGMESFVNKDGVSRGFANEIQGLEPL